MCVNSTSKAEARDRERSGLRVAGVMNIDAHWEKTTASALAATGEDCTTVLSLHPRAESKLTFTRAFRGLIGAFHRPGAGGKRGATVAVDSRLSTKGSANFCPGLNHCNGGQLTPSTPSQWKIRKVPERVNRGIPSPAER